MADPVTQLTSEYLDLVFETFPTAATLFGRHEHDARLEDLTPERLDDFTRRLADLRRRVRAVMRRSHPPPVVHSRALIDWLSRIAQPSEPSSESGTAIPA